MKPNRSVKENEFGSERPVLYGEEPNSISPSSSDFTDNEFEHQKTNSSSFDRRFSYRRPSRNKENEQGRYHHKNSYKNNNYRLLCFNCLDSGCMLSSVIWTRALSVSISASLTGRRRIKFRKIIQLLFRHT